MIGATVNWRTMRGIMVSQNVCISQYSKLMTKLLDPCIFSLIEKGGWNFDSWNEHQRVMKYALSNEANSALTLQLPGVLQYTRDVMLPNFQKYVAGEFSCCDKVYCKMFTDEF